MLVIFRSGGHNYFAEETLVQIQRTLGAHEARGTISSPTQLVEALLGQYHIFVGSLVVSLAAGLIWLVSTARAIRGRSLAPLAGTRCSIAGVPEPSSSWARSSSNSPIITRCC
jgi:hypothetical protein